MIRDYENPLVSLNKGRLVGPAIPMTKNWVGELGYFFLVIPGSKTQKGQPVWLENGWLGGGLKYFLFSPLFGEDSHFD